MKLFRYIVAVVLAVTVWMPLKAEEAAAIWKLEFH